MADIITDFNDFLDQLRIFLVNLDVFDSVVLALMVLGIVPVVAFIRHLFRSIVKNTLAIAVLVALGFCVYFGFMNNWVSLGGSAVIAGCLIFAMIYVDRKLPEAPEKPRERTLSEMAGLDEKPGRKRNRGG